MRRLFLLGFCLFLLACNAKAVGDFQIVDNRVVSRNGLKVQVDKSFVFVGVGKDALPIEYKGKNGLVTGQSCVFVKPAVESKIGEIAAVSVLNEIPFYAFNPVIEDAVGIRETIGAYDYLMSIHEGMCGSELFYELFLVGEEGGYSSSLHKYYMLRYSRSFSKRIRCMTYVVDSHQLPDHVRARYQIEEYLKKRFHEVFKVE